MSDRSRGERVRTYRKHAGMTQRDLATAMAVGRTTIANVEAGTQGLTLANATKLARLFGVTLDAVVGLDTAADSNLGHFDIGYQRGREDGLAIVTAAVQNALRAVGREGTER